MCLIYPKIEKRIKNGKPRRVYKIVGKAKPHCYSVFEYYTWTNGTMVSNRESSELTEDELETGAILKGFHVFFDMETAEKYLEDFNCMCSVEDITILTCIGNPEDYVCTGEWEGDDDGSDPICGVYTKLRVEKRELARALKRDYSYVSGTVQ